MTHRDIEDGMGFGGLVESPEERRARRNSGGMSKFQAATIYNNGVRFALFREPVSVDFALQHPLWRLGFDWGTSMKQKFTDDRNSALRAMDIDPIQEMRLQQ